MLISLKIHRIFFQMEEILWKGLINQVELRWKEGMDLELEWELVQEEESLGIGEKKDAGV